MLHLLLILGFLLTPHADAHAAGLLDSCTPPVKNCDSDLHCPGLQFFGQSLKYNSQVCFPEKKYKPCGSDGDCVLQPNKRTNCAAVQNPGTGKAAAVCLADKDIPLKDKGDEIADKCSSTTSCGPNQQCVRVFVWDDEFFGVSEFVNRLECVDTSILPATMVEADKTGSCGQNQACSATQSCVENTFVETQTGLSGPLVPKSYVCYDSSKISGNACSPVASTCTNAPGGKNGYCMNVFKDSALTPVCINIDTMPGGPGAPSDVTCTSDKNCATILPNSYCLKNPATDKNQCFTAQNIFTDMADPTKQLCGGVACACTLPGKKDCLAGKESICAQYIDKPAVSVCINYADNGAALGAGKGTATQEPEHLKADVAAQTYKMYAPKLEIDIPNLTFVDKISAQDGPGGIKRFSVPYLATYINAAYKYAIGLGVLIAVVVLMYAGMRWMTSFGNTKAIDSAKTSVRNSALGLFLLFSAYTVLYVINPELPKMKALQILAPKQEQFNLSAEYQASSEQGAALLKNGAATPPKEVNGKYLDPKVPPASTCSAKQSEKNKKSTTQEMRDAAYAIQTQYGYPAAVMLAQRIIEGGTFGIKCGKYLPSEKGDEGVKATLSCQDKGADCNPGYTWECLKPQSPLLINPGLATSDKNPIVDCGSGEKKGMGYTKSHGYACFKSPPPDAGPFDRLLNFYEHNKCIKAGRDEYGGDPTEFAAVLQKCGYATGQGYAAFVVSMMKNNCLLDTSKPAAIAVPDSSPADAESKDTSS